MLRVRRCPKTIPFWLFETRMIRPWLAPTIALKPTPTPTRELALLLPHPCAAKALAWLCPWLMPPIGARDHVPLGPCEKRGNREMEETFWVTIATTFNSFSIPTNNPNIRPLVDFFFTIPILHSRDSLISSILIFRPFTITV